MLSPGSEAAEEEEKKTMRGPPRPGYSFCPSAQFTYWAWDEGPCMGPRYPARVRVHLRVRMPPPLLRVPLSSSFD